MMGINFRGAELAAKRMGLLRELVPRAARVAVLLNPDEARRSESILRNVEAAAGTYPSSRHQLSRLAPWPRETGLAGWATGLELRNVVQNIPLKSHTDFR